MPVLSALQHNRYLTHASRGVASPDFLLLAERRLRVSLDWSQGDDGRALESLGQQMDRDDNLFLQVLELAIQNIELGYSFQQQDEALAELDRILTEAGSVWRVDIQRVESSSEWRGHRGYREIRTLQRRTLPEAVDTLQALSKSAPAASTHLGSAWNHAFGRSPDPGRAYSEAIKAVEAAAIPVVLPHDLTATLGKVLGQLRSAPKEWQVVLSGAVPLQAGGQMPSIEVITNMAALLWENQTDRHAPVRREIEQAQAEMAVHLALTLVYVFTRSVRSAK